MCAPRIPVSSEGWEEVRSFDSEVRTVEPGRAGAGKIMHLGDRLPVAVFFLVVPKPIPNTPSESVFPV